MYKLQNWKTKLVYIGFGSFFGCLCTIMGMLVSPVTAQRDKFGDIECTSLRIVDKNGKWKASLGVDEHGGYMRVYDSIGNRVLNVNGHGEVECISLRVVDLLKI